MMLQPLDSREGLSRYALTALADLDLPEGVQAAALVHGGDAAQAVVSVHLPRVIEPAEGEAAEAVAGAGGEQTPS